MAMLPHRYTVIARRLIAVIARSSSGTRSTHDMSTYSRSSTSTNPKQNRASARGMSEMSGPTSLGLPNAHARPSAIDTAAGTSTFHSGRRRIVPSWWANPRIQQAPNVARSVITSPAEPEGSSTP